MAKGLPCEKCGGESKVTLTNETTNHTLRTRKCMGCSFIFQTVENVPNKCRNCNLNGFGCYKTFGKENVIIRKRECLLCYYRVTSHEIRIREVEPIVPPVKKVF